MIIYTIGFTKKDAKTFFELLKENGIDLLLDIRLNNKSQLAGFAKGNDLRYFMPVICKADYDHDTIFAPTKELLNDYKRGIISWGEYVKIYNNLMIERSMDKSFNKKYKKYQRVCLLCSEETPNNCHRRLLAEYLSNRLDGIESIIHL